MTIVRIEHRGGPAQAVIRLKPADAARYARLRLRMLTVAPWAFAAGSDDDVALDIDHLTIALAEEHNAILAVEAPERPVLYEQPELIASAGILRGTRPKFGHRARIWGVFVEEVHRGMGLGRTVMTAAIDVARGWPGLDFIDLGVSENAPEARRLYDSLGFREWGREPEATAHGGKRYDEIYMTLRL